VIQVSRQAMDAPAPIDQLPSKCPDRCRKILAGNAMLVAAIVDIFVSK